MDIEEYLGYIRRYEIPPIPPQGLMFDYIGSMEQTIARGICTDHGCWTVVADSWLRPLAEWIGDRKVLEIMAGGGWIAKGLRNHDVNIIATDDGSWNHKHEKMKELVRIERFEAVDAVKAFPDAEVLLASWPPYDNDAIFEACEEWSARGPIIYIGEDRGGCNAPDVFFEHFLVEDRIEIPQWYGLHDILMIGNWIK